MKRQIPCDDVFEILTRGPFPSGDATDQPVELHLAACHECRQLAEALRPAVDLFHEAVPSTELDDLPGYHGSLLEMRVTSRPLRAATTTVATAPRQTSARLWWTQIGTEFALTKLAASVLLGAAVCALCWGLAGNARSPAPHQQIANAAAVHDREHKIWPSDEGWELLRSLNLPTVCVARLARFPESPYPAHDATQISADDQLDCCTRCHSAANPSRPPLESVAALWQSCRACHAE